MSYRFRLACTTALVALVSTVSNLHAAPACSSIVAKQRLQVAGPGGTQACAQNCEVAGLDAAIRQTLPAPTHLPVVSAPDEVAAWHAEIFEQLAAARASTERTQYCKLEKKV